MSQENEGEMQKKFPQSATKARELFETIVNEVGFWRNSHLGQKGEMTFELPYPPSGAHTELPEGMVKLIEQLRANFEFPFPSEDGYFYAIARAPYWDNSWYLSKKTLVRTKSEDVLHYLVVYNRFLDQHDSLLKKEREGRKEERRELIQQLGRQSGADEPGIRIALNMLKLEKEQPRRGPLSIIE